MTASIRCTTSASKLPMIGQSLRRSYEHLLVSNGQMLVMVPAVGTVLMTEKCSVVQLDLVADNDVVMSGRMLMVESDIRQRVRGTDLRFDWAKAAAIPVPFR